MWPALTVVVGVDPGVEDRDGLAASLHQDAADRSLIRLITRMVLGIGGDVEPRHPEAVDGDRGDIRQAAQEGLAVGEPYAGPIDDPVLMPNDAAGRGDRTHEVGLVPLGGAHQPTHDLLNLVRRALVVDRCAIPFEVEASLRELNDEVVLGNGLFGRCRLGVDGECQQCDSGQEIVARHLC